MAKSNQKNILSDDMFKHIYREKRALTSFLKGFFSYIQNEEALDEINHQIEYMFKKEKRKTKDNRGDIIVYTKHYIISIEAYTVLNLEGLKKASKYISKIDGEELSVNENYVLDTRKIIQIIIAGEVSSNLNILDTWFQRYHYKSDGPKYIELPHNTEIYILNIDKAKKIFYYDGRSDLLVKHLKIIGEESPKVRKQIAREEEDLMVIASEAIDFRNARRNAKYFNEMSKAKTIAYGEGKEEGIEIGRDESVKKIAKSMLKKYSFDEIIEITGLSLEEIKEIQNENSSH